MRAFLGISESASLRRAVKSVLLEMRIAAVHGRAVRRAKRCPNSLLRLNCGSGPNHMPGWVNIDAFSPRADLHLDLRRPFPFPDRCAKVVYSEHFFEHLEYPSEAMLFLTESLRVLEPGGLFRVGVPDTEWPLRAYMNADDEYFRIARERWHPKWCDTRMPNINYHFRQVTQHKYAYDYETLAKVVAAAGFADIERAHFDPTVDTEARRMGTLYVIARRPAHA